MIKIEPVNILCTDGITRTGGILTCGCGVTAFHVYLIDLPHGTHLHYQCPDCNRTFCAEGCAELGSADMTNPFSYDPEAN